MNAGKCCVGGITEGGRYVRLLTSRGENQPTTIEMSVRQVWQIEFIEKKDVNAPHVEDVLIQSQTIKEVLNAETKVLDFITQRNVPIWRGSPDILFDGTLKWTTNGSGYIIKEAVPAHSVGFWVSDKNLTKRIFREKTRYTYPNADAWRSIPYVGFDKPVESIPAGTLIRVSLTRWWDTKGTTEQRCQLQISGWYDLS